jgi:hypothetical protein
VTKINLDELIPGKVLCDMHDGLAVLEERIPGFVLLHHSRIETDTAHEIMDGLFMEYAGKLVTYFEWHNKLLYYYEQEISGLHKAVYGYDGRWFGIVTFRIETDAEKKLEKAFAKC